jgi:hypothetical protein
VIVSSSLAIALSFAKAGVRIIPVKVFREGDQWRKRPHIVNWRNRASADVATVEEWWQEFPLAVPGIVLEHLGQVVVDCDRHPGKPDGIAAFNALSVENRFAPHPIVRTAGGGEHHYFLQTSPPLEGMFVPIAGIEVHGMKRFVVAPGCGGYELIADADVPELPEVFRRPKASRKIDGDRKIAGFEEEPCVCAHGGREFEPTKDFHARIAAIVKWLERARPGERSNTLFSTACLMAEMTVLEGKPTPNVAETLLMGGCWVNGLVTDYGKTKCRDTIANAYRRIVDRYTPSPLPPSAPHTHGSLSGADNDGD